MEAAPQEDESNLREHHARSPTVNKAAQTPQLQVIPETINSEYPYECIQTLSAWPRSMVAGLRNDV